MTPWNSKRRTIARPIAVLAAASVALPILAAGSASAASTSPPATGLAGINHFVLIFQENNSFDKLYGSWEGVNGLAKAPSRAKNQVDQNGNRLNCLLQTDSALTTPPLTPVCSGADAGGKPFESHFANGPFNLQTNLPGEKDTLDLRHNFYQERYQINGGKMNRFPIANDISESLAMGNWDTKAMPIYKYLHSKKHPNYAIATNFFHAAFGGSFLNHQWLIAAATPKWPGALNDGSGNDRHAVIDSNQMPGTYPKYTLYKSPFDAAQAATLADGQLTASCSPPTGIVAPPKSAPCGDYVVNTSQPTYQPYQPGTAIERRVPPLTNRSIADQLTKKKVSWGWYSSGWSNAAGLVGKPGWTNGSTSCTDQGTQAGAQWPNCPNQYFQFHHQPFNYFKAFNPSSTAGSRNRSMHLKDASAFNSLVAQSPNSCKLREVNFVKFMANSNEHPSYGPPQPGDQEAVDLIEKIQNSDCAKDTMVILSYDENGGAWDHVTPPGQPGGAAGPADKWGPGTRIPTIVIAPGLRSRFVVDRVSHDTTSILKTIQVRYGLGNIGNRDARVSSLASVFQATRR